MLITICLIVAIIIFLIIGAICWDSWPAWSQIIGIVSCIICILSSIALVGCLFAIITVHVNPEGHFAAYQAEKEILEYRLDQKEYLNDNNVGLTELMEDITKYNTNLTKAQHGLHNPWTSWFYADYVDELELIILGDVD